MVLSKTFNIKFKKIAICLFLIKGDISIYERILDINEEIDDEELEKQVYFNLNLVSFESN
jgi:hypothetical protein